ncbi:hypothetical protein [Mesorhizobium sp. B1-1-8]|uniref:hypothetical protein n=1 Tax=Mesorhizobium sp. B1-1-8 TaxID=2589976 RepID=UPI0015E2852E|nr:hypothetical protein [Mesorhizobium sp. B1-1-8]UCI06426.1 hypothetical protein FJ974_21815 [Mesorhizobium sp. B1-1-8]
MMSSENRFTLFGIMLQERPPHRRKWRAPDATADEGTLLDGLLANVLREPWFLENPAFRPLRRDGETSVLPKP